MNLESIFGQVANTILNHASPNTPGPSYDANPLLGAISNIFGQSAQQSGQSFNGYNQNADYSQHGTLSSDQDPYGDPGMQGGGQNASYGNVQSSDNDPYGDPGLQR